MNLVDSFNAVEAGLWVSFAILVATIGGRVRGLTPRLRVAFTACFLAFGSSDVIELYTGAWWRPPGLLFYKGGCLCGFVLCSLFLWRRRRVPRTDA